MDVIKGLSDIDRSLELLIRGGISVGGKMQNISVDMQVLLNNVQVMFDWASIQQTDFDMNKSNHDKDNLKLTVSIFNKARNLTSVYDLLKAQLKGMSAFLLHLYSNPSAKCLSTTIKLFSKAAEELATFEICFENAIKCAMACTSLWKRICNSTNLLVKQLTPIELESLKISVYYAYMQTAVLSVIRKDIPIKVGDSPRQAVAAATELVNQLPPGIKLNFINTAMPIAQELVSKNLFEDANAIFSLIMTIVDILSSSKSNLVEKFVGSQENQSSRTSMYDMFQYKLKLWFSMAYCNMNMKQFDKAKMHLNNAEQALAKANFDMKQFSEDEKRSKYATLDYAKFQVMAAENDWNSAEKHLRNYMKQQPTSYEVALELITLFLKGNEMNNQKYIIEFYAMLISFFPNDPYFTNTRICNLEISVANISLHGDFANDTSSTKDTSQTKRAMDLCDAIITDHLNKTHSLYQDFSVLKEKNYSTNNYKRVVKVILGRVKWHNSTKEWTKLKEWADLYMKLHGDKVLDDDTMNVVIYKIEALLSENVYKSNEDALNFASKLITARVTNRSLLCLFKSLLYSRGAKDAVKHFIELQKNREVEGNISALRGTENLSRIIDCFFIVIESSKTVSSQQCQLAKIYLLREWLSQFADSQVWRDQVCNNEESQNLSYFIVCKELMIAYVGSFPDVPSEVIKAANDGDNKDSIAAMSTEELQNDGTKPIPLEGQNAMDIDSMGDTASSEIPHLFKNIFSVTDESISLLIPQAEFYSNIVEPLRQVGSLLAQLNQQHHPALKLGSNDDLEWLADFAWNIGVIVSPKQMKSEVGSSDFHKRKEYLSIAADMLEIAAKLYGNIVCEAKTVSVTNQVMCLILSCGCRLDKHFETKLSGALMNKMSNRNEKTTEMEADIDSGSFGFSLSLEKSHSSSVAPGSSLNEDLSIVIKTIEEVESLVRSLTGFADNDFAESFKSITLVYMIGTYCKQQNDQKLQEFVKTKERDLFCLTALELQQCATIAKEELHGVSDTSRIFLKLAIQACIRNEPRDYSLLGQIFNEIIESSPSRSHALQYIEEFEQMLKTDSPFSVDDIDAIAKLSYNHGITLMELQHTDLAEKFISLSLSLSKHTSESFKLSNIESMQDAYKYLLEQIQQEKEQNHRSSGISDIIGGGMSIYDKSLYKNTDKERDAALTLAFLQ